MSDFDDDIIVGGGLTAHDLLDENKRLQEAMRIKGEALRECQDAVGRLRSENENLTESVEIWGDVAQRAVDAAASSRVTSLVHVPAELERLRRDNADYRIELERLRDKRDTTAREYEEQSAELEAKNGDIDEVLRQRDEKAARLRRIEEALQMVTDGYGHAWPMSVLTIVRAALEEEA